MWTGQIHSTLFENTERLTLPRVFGRLLSLLLLAVGQDLLSLCVCEGGICKTSNLSVSAKVGLQNVLNHPDFIDSLSPRSHL